MSSTEVRLPPHVTFVGWHEYITITNIYLLYYNGGSGSEGFEGSTIAGKVMIWTGGGTRGGYGKKYAWLKNTATRPIFSNDRVFF